MTYTDGQSIHNNAYADFQKGRDDNACGSNVGAKLRIGDIVIISAKHNKIRSVIIGEITDDLGPNYPLWQMDGGKLWQYNYRYRPLVHQISENDEEYGRLRSLCEKSGLELHKLFNPNRFAGGPYKNKYSDILNEFLNTSKYRL